MGAELLSKVENSPVSQIRKPENVEVLDVSLLDKPMKEVSDFGDTIGSPDSVLSARPQEKISEISSGFEPMNDAESFTFDTPGITTRNGDFGAEKAADLDVHAGEKIYSIDPTGVAPKEALFPATVVNSDKPEDISGENRNALEAVPSMSLDSSAKASIANEIQEMEEISLEEDRGQSTPVEKGVVTSESQLGMNKMGTSSEQVVLPKKSVLQLVKNWSNTDDSDAAGGGTKPIATVVKTKQIASLLKAKADDSAAGGGVMKISSLLKAKTDDSPPGRGVMKIASLLKARTDDTAAGASVKQVATVLKPKTEDSAAGGLVKQLATALTGKVDETATVGIFSSNPTATTVQTNDSDVDEGGSTPDPTVTKVQTNDADVDEGGSTHSTTTVKTTTDDSNATAGVSKQTATVLEEKHVAEPQSSTVDSEVGEESTIESKVSEENTVESKVGEESVKVDPPVSLEAPAAESQSAVVEASVAELQVKTEVAKPVERPERDDKFASAIESLPTSRFARAAEILEASEPSTPPTPERAGSSVIRLTRQMSRVSTGMGPMSPRFELRAAKEIQDLQEKVKNLEEELRRKSAAFETQSINYKEKESELLNKIECLELANEQLLQGGNDSSIQLQMELTRLQRQNSVLQLRERELQFQINTQEMIKSQMLDNRPAKAEATNPVNELESKVAILESKLAEAVEVSNMYKIQLHEAFTRQKSVQSAALLNLGDGEDVLKELQRLRKQTKEQEAELVDLQDRFFITTVRLAEAAAHKEELLSKLKRIQGVR
ncbi:uncharacterized protein [Physcomitrium patens]|uniref:Uncharacterized protein n=1 Tax=Physcomitrium patens TaxID=3218 RepID=A0A2K1J3R8_PHYPA|nr:restin homolog [Physcomitrium patens]PNR36168.1 hypothetical protein PHYPA_022019 [Physcomitrium patens]|eukprot:XP_024401475.1 restin homolog [Physcomitrella patens]